jgi:hypothetical protein
MLMSLGGHVTHVALCTFQYADALKFAVVANVSIASLNLSLLVNSVGFYQVSTSVCSRCSRIHHHVCWMLGPP